MRIGIFRTLNFKYLQMPPINSIKLISLIKVCSENYQRIMEHLRAKLDVPTYEWRRVLKVITNINIEF
jgi:hypothetical protein